MTREETMRILDGFESLNKRFGDVETAVAVLDAKVDRAIEDIERINETLNEPPEAISHRLVAVEERLKQKDSIGEFLNSKTFKAIVAAVITALGVGAGTAL